ncbi:unnamed protein product [Clonostachys rosea]|uniref:Major facilitator superfamily (MFS) profile domain-containing protein n=1 Tax=Bionectria ochroleuca TaxID=29856 RepID=A0ABY6UQA1_BIOOC|nr:unnamed protein product [Clonostachys rosea]
MSNHSTVSPTGRKPGVPQRITLGTIQLRDQETNEIILVPTPSNDPNDPLNWSRARKYYIFTLACCGIFFAHASIVGPAVSLGAITAEFFGDGPDAIANHLQTTSYLQTTCSLMIGVGNLIWVPLAIKFGRRPVYMVSYILLTACVLWSGAAKSFASSLVARILLGLACAAPEIIVPLTITDIFFLHQRGRAMVVYGCALSTGVGVGVVFAGLITRDYGWRMVFWIFSAFVIACTVCVLLFFPETNYNRQENAVTDSNNSGLEGDKPSSQWTDDVRSQPTTTLQAPPARATFLQDMKFYSHTFTTESVWALTFRPLIAILLPAVLWATFINAVSQGMIVVISANFSTAFAEIYGFTTWQAGLTYISTIVGSLIAIFLGGHFTDWVADVLTRRNRGVRTPEMRLPAIAVSLVSGPLACILYGVGLAKRLHWIVPTIGIGLVNFTTVQSNNVALVYLLDSYRPIAGEVIVTQSVFKGLKPLLPSHGLSCICARPLMINDSAAIISFLLSFYVNAWVQSSGYLTVFGILTGVSAAVLLSTVLFYTFGNKIRHATWNWGIIRRFLHWHPDREVGE